MTDFSCLGFGCGLHGKCERYALVETAPELPRRGTCATKEGFPLFVKATAKHPLVADSHNCDSPTAVDRQRPTPSER